MIQERRSVEATGRVVHIPVNEAYLGRLINALGRHFGLPSRTIKQIMQEAGQENQ